MFNPERGPEPGPSPEEQGGKETKEVQRPTAQDFREAIELAREIKEIGKSVPDSEMFREAESRMGDRFKRYTELAGKVDAFVKKFGAEEMLDILAEERESERKERGGESIKSE